MKLTDYNREFSDRPLVHVNKNIINAPATSLIMAVPVTSDEIIEIKTANSKNLEWKGITTKNIVAMGDTLNPTAAVLNYLVFSHTVDVNTGAVIRSYFYPRTNTIPDRTHHCIPFESAAIAWNYYAKILTNNPKFKDVIVVKTNIEN